MPSTAELKAAFLDSIKPGVSLDDTFFRKLYGWSMTDPEFLETAVLIGETLWGLPIREPYQSWVQAYEAEQEQISREVGEWYGKRMDQQREEVKGWNRVDLHQKSDRELLSLLKSLNSRRQA